MTVGGLINHYITLNTSIFAGRQLLSLSVQPVPQGARKPATWKERSVGVESKPKMGIPSNWQTRFISHLHFPPPIFQHVSISCSHPGPGSTLPSLGLAPRVVAIVWMSVSIHSARMIHEAVTTELMSTTWNCPSFRRLCNTVAMYIVLCSLWSPLCCSILFLLLWVPATTT